eukprot:CAMPEP_0194494964 /NCGR_PEP_ID=MMETSP0253-20130528/12714_1 /TAXON_ID=2966 /ORGANISM="Noctiluca scintillans" /LENGTH=76 /DNA_ID=CAMNT_0039336153 /DNA_START=65 /DNA_END=292 /DNA_ORIENTATION=+
MFDDPPTRCLVLSQIDVSEVGRQSLCQADELVDLVLRDGERFQQRSHVWCQAVHILMGDGRDGGHVAPRPVSRLNR